jgi:hypothetical protein
LITLGLLYCIESDLLAVVIMSGMIYIKREREREKRINESFERLKTKK